MRLTKQLAEDAFQESRPRRFSHDPISEIVDAIWGDRTEQFDELTGTELELTSVMARLHKLEAANASLAARLKKVEQSALTRSVNDAHVRVVKSAIQETFSEAAVEDWDGPGSKPVTSETFQTAQAIAELIPCDCDPPHVSADVGGRILFEWMTARDQMVTLAVAATELSYAGLFGTNRVFGAEAFDGTLPVFLINALDKLYRESARVALGD
jgi:hypothetical protein